MASMDGYIQLLNTCGHKVKLIEMDGIQMKETRIKAARHIF